MAISTIYALQKVINISTSSSTNGGNLVNYPMNHSEFVLLSETRNIIQFMLRDLDRKNIVLAPGAVPYLQIFGDSGFILYEQPLTLGSAAQALYYATIDRSSISDWTNSSYKYAVYVLDSYGFRTAMYTDRGGSATGICEVRMGPVPPPRQPTVISPSDFILRDGVSYSGAYPGAATVGNQSGQGTASFYLTGFVGTIQIEGSLDMNISTDDSQWFNVNTQTISTPQSGTIGQPFVGNFTYIRFVVNAVSGSVDKTIYTV